MHDIPPTPSPALCKLPIINQSAAHQPCYAREHILTILGMRRAEAGRRAVGRGQASTYRAKLQGQVEEGFAHRPLAP
jgi:hypothetical protein